MSNRVRPSGSTGRRTRPEPTSGGRQGLPVWLPIAIIGAVVAVIVVVLVASGGDDSDDAATGDAPSSTDPGDDAPSETPVFAFGPVEVVGASRTRADDKVRENRVVVDHDCGDRP